MTNTRVAIYPHVLKLEQPFKPNKLERFYWERSIGGYKTKVYAYIFDGSSVEALLYCALHFLEQMNIMFYPAMLWQAEWSKCLRSNKREIYQQIQLNTANKGNPFPQTAEGFNRMLTVFVEEYVTDPEARETQIEAFKFDSEFAYN